MEVDKVYVIHLSYRADRKNSILKELRRTKIGHFEFFNAIEVKTRQHLHKINPNFLINRPWWLKGEDEAYFQQYRLGALGCLLSHLGVMKKALQAGHRRILILEDDAIFATDQGSWKQMCDAYRGQYAGPDPSYDILYLGGMHLKTKLRRFSQNLYQTKNSGGGHAYIIGTKMMKYVVKNAVAFGKEIDMFYIERVQPLGKCVCILPPPVYQSEGFSDICQEKRSYDKSGVYGPDNVLKARGTISTQGQPSLSY